MENNNISNNNIYNVFTNALNRKINSAKVNKVYTKIRNKLVYNYQRKMKCKVTKIF